MSQKYSCLVNSNMDDDNKLSNFPNTDSYLNGVIDGILASTEKNMSNKQYNIVPMPTTNYAAVSKPIEHFTEYMESTSSASHTTSSNSIAPPTIAPPIVTDSVSIQPTSPNKKSIYTITSNRNSNKPLVSWIFIGVFAGILFIVIIFFILSPIISKRINKK